MRVLFVGLGGVGQRHLRNLRTILGEQLEPIAYRVRGENSVVTDQLSTREGGHLDRDFGISVYNNLECALALRPQICIIANPSALHIPVARKVAAAGVDLFIEKPLSSELSEVPSLVQLVEQAKLVAYVAYQLRFHPAVIALFDAMDRKVCGRIYGASAEISEYLPDFHPYEDYRRMYASRKELGGGVILTQIHELDLIYRLFGRSESVFCVGGHLSDLEIDVEDSATSILQYRATDGTPWAVTLHQDYLGHPPRRSLIIRGSQGTLTLNLRLGQLTFLERDGQSRVLCDASDYPRNELFINEMRHFLDCVASRTEPCVSLRDGLASLELAVALQSSLASGTLVQLDRMEHN